MSCLINTIVGVISSFKSSKSQISCEGKYIKFSGQFDYLWSCLGYEDQGFWPCNSDNKLGHENKRLKHNNSTNQCIVDSPVRRHFQQYS